MELVYRPDEKGLKGALERVLREGGCGIEEIDTVMIGVNGNPGNDEVYARVCPWLFPGKRLARYKHLFGESYTAPALGVYAAAVTLHRQHVPAHLFVEAGEGETRGVKHVLFYNQFEDKNHSFILLSRCGE
jgi:hypothetical protein